MADFEVLVRRVLNVVDHPNADRLSICTIMGYEAITAKNEDGTHRFEPGDLIVYVPEQALVPHDLLKQYGYWDEAKDRGMLAGKQGDRVKIIKLRGVYSQGLVWPVFSEGAASWVKNGKDRLYVDEGTDLAAFFGITKHEPKAASFQTGTGRGGIDQRVVMAMPEFAFSYDFNSLQKDPTILAQDEVEVTEKLHGTLTRVSYRPGVTHPDLFGPHNDVAITTKGQGAKGIVFRNNKFNLGPLYKPTEKELRQAVWAKRLSWFPWLVNKLGLADALAPTPGKVNLYVDMALSHGLVDAVSNYGYCHDCAVDLVGETYGEGVQKGYSYGQSAPTFRAFDVIIDGVALSADEKEDWLRDHGIARVPVLFRGLFDLDVLLNLRDGKTTIDGNGKKHIREGIVVTSAGCQKPRERGGRPIQKMVSPDYLMKEDGTEVQ